MKTETQKTIEARENVRKLSKEYAENKKCDVVFDQLGIVTANEAKEQAKDEPLTTEQIVNQFKER
jgi:hypothetical protein